MSGDDVSSGVWLLRSESEGDVDGTVLFGVAGGGHTESEGVVAWVVSACFGAVAGNGDEWSVALESLSDVPFVFG